MSEEKLLDDKNKDLEAIGMSWTSDIDNLLAGWCDKAKCYEWMHMKSFDINNNSAKKFMIIINILTTISGLSNVILGNYNINGFQMTWLFGSISIIVSTLNILQDKLGFQQYAENHKRLASDWAMIINKIEEVIILPPSGRRDCKTFLRYIKADINNAILNKNSPIPEKIRQECFDKFKNVENFNIPDICGQVEHTKVYEYH